MAALDPLKWPLKQQLLLDHRAVVKMADINVFIYIRIESGRYGGEPPGFRRACHGKWGYGQRETVPWNTRLQTI
jgi:hypothetical protein